MPGVGLREEIAAELREQYHRHQHQPGEEADGRQRADQRPIQDAAVIFTEPFEPVDEAVMNLHQRIGRGPSSLAMMDGGDVAHQELEQHRDERKGQAQAGDQ